MVTEQFHLTMIISITQNVPLGIDQVSSETICL